MKKFVLLMILCLSATLNCAKPVLGRTPQQSPTVTVVEPTPSPVPTTVVVKGNITEPKQTVDELEEMIKTNRVGSWNGINSLRKLVELAVDRGVAANTIVLLLLLPLIATFISVLHYVFGLSGYGIFMPTMMAVAFLATGVAGGMTLFGVILAISLVSNLFLKKLRLHFWPARAINLVLIGWGTFGLMIASSYFWVIDLKSISIFPILFMILLTEEFVRTQLAKSKSEAKKLMIGTLILAVVGAVTMQIKSVQQWVLLYPGVSLVLGIVVNVLVGNYTGIRWLEIKRFSKAIRNKGKK